MSYSQRSAPSGQRFHPMPPPPARQPVRPHSALTIVVGAGCALLVCGLGVAVGGGKKAEARPVPTVTARTEQATAEKSNGTPGRTVKATAPDRPVHAAGPGSYLVGKDLAPGAYRTGGPAGPDAPRCSWTRAKAGGGERAGLVAEGTSRGPARVTVHEGETFATTGCRPWTKAG
ncbi:hypothetical protein [Streptomyces sp. NPDC048612]|uniref:hypothetical protein n=1 Tax=Streptomyces sp. NPDC048612 TaxID=3365579 RepID=UPI0037172988